MRQRLREARRQESGFTLIELLIVIVILGILAAVVVIAVGAFDDRGQAAACKSDVKSVEVAVEAYRAKEGHYPDAGQAGFDQLKAGGYLREQPSTANYTVTLDADGVVGGVVNGQSCGGNAEALPTGGDTTSPGGGQTTTTQAATAPTAAPTNFNASDGSGSGTKISVSWTAVGTGSNGGSPITGYSLQVQLRNTGGTTHCFDGQNSNTVTTVAIGTTSPFTYQTGLNDGSTYCARLAAVNAVGTGPYSTPDTATAG